MSDPVRCRRNCEDIPRVVPETKVTNRGPARGILLSQAYVVCACGWTGPKQPTTAKAILAWNEVMEVRNELAM